MAFFMTLASRNQDGNWLLREKTKARLAGPHGPLATHISNLPAAATGEWNLTAIQIIGHFNFSSSNDEEIPLLMWDSGEPDSCPMRVMRVCGVSREFDTELLVQTEVLEPAGDGLRSTGRHVNEALRLLGGRITPKSKWVWAAPKMSIGSMVVGL